MARLIKRGDIWVVNLEPGFGREIRKKRPAVIISRNRFNESTPYVIVVPASSIMPNKISEEIVPISKIKGLDKDSVLLPLLIRSVDQKRLVKKVGVLSKNKLEEVEEALKLVLGMINLD